MGRCWEGYKPVPGKKPYSEGSCVKKTDIDPDSQYVKIKDKSGWHRIIDITDSKQRVSKDSGGNKYTVECPHTGKNMTVGQHDITSHAFGEDIESLHKSVVVKFFNDNTIEYVADASFSQEAEDALIKHLESMGYVEDLSKGLKAEHKSSKGGMTRAGVEAYRRENPGSKLQTAVTEKDPKGSRAKRRKSFCARMSGNPGPMKDEKGRPTRKALALRRWRC